MDVILGTELVLTFKSAGIVEKFYVGDPKMAWRLALIIIAEHGNELHAGAALSVEQRRRPSLIEG
jgi:hypothetical protein